MSECQIPRSIDNRIFGVGRQLLFYFLKEMKPSDWMTIGNRIVKRGSAGDSLKKSSFQESKLLRPSFQVASFQDQDFKFQVFKSKSSPSIKFSSSRVKNQDQE